MDTYRKGDGKELVGVEVGNCNYNKIFPKSIFNKIKKMNNSLINSVLWRCSTLIAFLDCV